MIIPDYAMHYTDENTYIDQQIEQAKGKLASSMTRLEAAIKTRVNRASQEARGTIVSAELVKGLQEEIAKLQNEKQELLATVDEQRLAYEELKLLSEQAAAALDAAISDLNQYKDKE